MDAVAVNRHTGLIVLDTDEVVRVDTMLDCDGDETNDPDVAISMIGQMQSGEWIAVDLTCFEEQALQ